MFRDFDSEKQKRRDSFYIDNFKEDDLFGSRSLDKELGQYFSYEFYNNDLLRLVDFYGRTPFDWYRNKKTGEIIWLDGHAKIDHYSNLGHTWGKTFANGDRLLLDGDSKLITYNGEVIHNFSKKKSSNFSGGIAFSDGGNNQDPSALRRGGRNVIWIDFGGAFEALIVILGFEVKGNTSKGKGTNGGKPTLENKIDDGINATDFGANAAKNINSGLKKKIDKPNNTQKRDSVRETFYTKDGKGTEIRSEIRIKRDNE